jgi:peptidoglycan/xylan/chitin deacetylase (PgdA/CDA1 family)
MFKSLLFFILPCLTLFAQDSLLFIIRVDDIQSRNVSYLPAGITPFESAVELRGGKVTWAVIPHRLIENMNTSGILTQQLISTVAKGHEIAQHGYNHICPKCNGTSHEYYCSSQYFNHPYAVQNNMTQLGLDLLLDSLGQIPKSFVPPGHQVDTTSYRVLVDNNFEFLSSNGVTKSYIFPGLFNLRHHQEYTWELTQANYQTKLSQALFDIKTNGMSDKYFIILLHDPFIRQGYQNGIVVNWMGELLDSLNSTFGDRIKYKTLSEAAKAFRDAGTSIADGSENFNMQFKLKQNFPNPFNPSTIISFQAPNEGTALLKVYDMLGNEIVTLLNGPISAGEHSVRFDANGMASGVYFYRLTINGSTLSGKMLLGK